MEPIAEPLLSLLRFLSLDSNRKLRYLVNEEQKEGGSTTYLLDESGVRTSNPLVAATYRAWDLIEIETWRVQGEALVVLRDLWSLLTIVLDQQPAYSYMWHLDKTTLTGSGPADDLWNVVARLARDALRAAGNDLGEPTLTFRDVMARTRVRT